MRELILTALEFAIGFVPADWRAFAFTALAVVRQVDWEIGDERWNELSLVIASWLRDAMNASKEMDADLKRQLRVAAELYATRELRRLNLLQVV